ncbi:hypothetical protein SAMN00777080_5080 [Aquiflexum balticum DSM 16537]|uniref:Uncharacterized protein n=1 Tax=Aquiflexum balticum DSM 16537 TaxID=758820 RepID=A0A1W2HC96_9BACT|nr:hypothetical protein [Aquiflexum balticum]SMD46391.1 hypothetical protein SAMN00777080_5080 [Aquiflexum balticum DSM 16537]
MERTENPVIERQIYWLKYFKIPSFIDFLNGKPKPFLDMAMLVAEDTDESNEVWFKYVDGIIELFIDNLSSKIKPNLEKSNQLTSKGFEIILNYIKNPTFQKAVIKRHQHGKDIITLSGNLQTIVSSKSLENFRKTTNKILWSENSFLELRKAYIDKVKKNHGLLTNDESSMSRNQKKTDLTPVQAGYMLYFLMGKHPNFKKCTSRNHVGIKENLKKLGIEKMSPNTVYQKGIRILNNAVKYKDFINPKDVAEIIPKLKKLDPEIATTAKNEFYYLIHGRD